jgi:L-alanine-DL-glutamate epimerase-like enolase superfamily enzyme
MRPGELAGELGGLEVVVEEVCCRFGMVSIGDYGPGGRPSTIVELSGQGHIGFGELVAFREEEHRAFAARLTEWLPSREGRVEGLVSGEAPPHERAALESALLDLAMRQAGLSLASLVGSGPGRLRWVASLGPVADPRPHLLRRRPGDPRPELKLDVHPDWSEEVVAVLREEGRVVILDFKGQGSPDGARRLSAAFPQAIFEDAPPGCGHPRLAQDRSLTRAAQVAAALEAGALVNLKAPRMGGPLELLRALERVPPGAERAYFGGMFEVGPGREQARQLAAIFCPGAPNDLAPLYGGASSLEGESPSAIRLHQPGFGATLDWLRLPLW